MSDSDNFTGIAGAAYAVWWAELDQVSLEPKRTMAVRTTTIKRYGTRAAYDGISDSTAIATHHQSSIFVHGTGEAVSLLDQIFQTTYAS